MADTTPYQKALDIRIAQGWQLGGNACPVLYTDTINGEQVCRDDLWLATTAGLKGTTNPALQAVKPQAGEAVPYLQERLADHTCERVEHVSGTPGLTLYMTKIGAHPEYQLYSSEALALWMNLGRALGELAAPAQAAIDAREEAPSAGAALSQACDLLSMSIGTLMGAKQKIGYVDRSPIARLIAEAVEFLRPWPEQMPSAAIDAREQEALVDALMLACEKFWWNDGPTGKTRDEMHIARNKVLAALASRDAAPAPAAAGGVTDEQIMALNAGERFFSESPSRFPEAGHGTQYHAGGPGVLGFARAVLALALVEMRAAWIEQFGESACDCRHEPENSGHVCQCCKAIAAISEATGNAALTPPAVAAPAQAGETKGGA